MVENVFFRKTSNTHVSKRITITLLDKNIYLKNEFRVLEYLSRHFEFKKLDFQTLYSTYYNFSKFVF